MKQVIPDYCSICSYVFSDKDKYYLAEELEKRTGMVALFLCSECYIELAQLEKRFKTKEDVMQIVKIYKEDPEFFKLYMLTGR